MTRRPDMLSRARALAFAIACAFAIPGVTGDAAAQAAPTREQVERRVESVGKLIDESSGAQQIASSGSAQAKADRERARALHRSAQDALRAGDLAGASRLLDDASKAMFDAVRGAAPAQVTASKDRRDYDARLASTQALVDAQRRIATEKGLTARDNELVRSIEALIAESQQKLAAGDVAEARKTLDQAYLLAKASVGGLRGGDTLVRSLSFASKEEEYRYELDRNDTHRMLIDTLMRDRSADARVDAAVGEATRLRQVAEEQSRRGDYDAGVQTLEQSTRELQRAIRGAGLYIPG